MKQNKSQDIKKHLLSYGHIDTWTAISKYRATRLSSIIYNLRADGYDIESVWVEKKRQPRFVSYTLIGEYDG